MVLSAPDEPRLAAFAARLCETLDPGASWPRVADTINRGRQTFAVRRVVEAQSMREGIAALQRLARGEADAPRGLLARAASAGVAVDWASDQPVDGPRLNLPGRPFLRKRHWPAAFDSVLAQPPAGPRGQAPGLPLHRIAWRHTPLQASAATLPVVLCGDEAMAGTLATELNAAGVAARAGRPKDAAQGEVVAWCVAGALEPSPQALAVEAEAAFAALLPAIGVLAERPRPLVMVTRDGARGAPVAAMALALARTLSLEHPELTCRRIDLDGDHPAPGSALAHALADPREEWLHLGAAGPRAPRLLPLPATAAAFAARPDAAYLVTGGGGGIGRSLVAHLARCGARDIAILSRTPGAHESIRELSERGVTVRLIAGDVSKRGDVGRALDTLDADGVPLAGVFHLAGVTSDGLLAHQDAAAIVPTLAAKAVGAAVLDEATRGRPLDQFVLFSSVSALSGLPGAGLYAAANGALEAVARRRRRAGLPALSVMWGTFAGSGMVDRADERLAKAWEAHGYRAFSPDDGFDALSTLLALDASEAVAAAADWGAVAAYAKATLFEGVGPLPPAASTGAISRTADPTTSQDSVATKVRHALAGTLGRQADDPALEEPFASLGLGSLAAIDFRTRLSDSLSIPLPATLAFNHPSAAAVTRFVEARLERPRAVAPAAPAPDDERRRLEALLERVEAEFGP